MGFGSILDSAQYRINWEMSIFLILLTKHYRRCKSPLWRKFDILLKDIKDKRKPYSWIGKLSAIKMFSVNWSVF